MRQEAAKLEPRQAYCEQCEALVEVVGSEEKRTNTGKAYQQGKCKTCGAPVYAIPPAAQTAR